MSINLTKSEVAALKRVRSGKTIDPRMAVILSREHLLWINDYVDDSKPVHCEMRPDGLRELEKHVQEKSDAQFSKVMSITAIGISIISLIVSIYALR